MYIDFGQKGLGPKTCKVCGMSYNVGYIEDENQHKQYHNFIVGGIDYPVIKKIYIYIFISIY